MVLVVVLGTFACFFKLSVATMGIDESAYLDAGWAYVHGDFAANAGHPLVAKLLIGISQLVLGQGLLAGRILGAFCGVATGVVLFDLGRRLAGRWAGLGAALLFVALPQAPGTSSLRLDRFVVLEPVAILLGVVGLWCTARWLGRPGLGWTVTAGLAFGLSASAKAPAVAYSLALALVVLTAAVPIAQKVRLLAVAVTSAAAGFLLPYLVAGNESGTHLRSIFHQVDHARFGHPQLIAGEVRTHHPWWANFWWQQTYLGWVATAALWVLAILGIVAVIRRGSRLLLAGGLGGPLLVLTATPLKLPHYHVLLIAPLVLSAGIGLADLLCAPLRLRRSNRLPVAALAIGVVAVLGVSAVRHLVDTALLRRGDYQLIPEVLADAGVPPGEIAVWGWPTVLDEYLGADYSVAGVSATDPVAVVVDPVTADRQRGSETERGFLELVGNRPPIAVDRLRVYVLAP